MPTALGLLVTLVADATVVLARSSCSPLFVSKTSPTFDSRPVFPTLGIYLTSIDKCLSGRGWFLHWRRFFLWRLWCLDRRLSSRLFIAKRLDLQHFAYVVVIAHATAAREHARDARDRTGLI